MWQTTIVYSKDYKANCKKHLARERKQTYINACVEVLKNWGAGEIILQKVLWEKMEFASLCVTISVFVNMT